MKTVFISFLTLLATIQANGENLMNLSCYEVNSKQPVFGLQLPNNIPSIPTGIAKVALANGQQLSGEFNAHVIIEQTRLQGYTNVSVTANYAFPDYGKPHTIVASLVGKDTPVLHYFGHAEIYSLTGKLVKQLFVNCQESL